VRCHSLITPNNKKCKFILICKPSNFFIITAILTAEICSSCINRMIKKILTIEENLRSDYEESRELFETKTRLMEQVDESTAELHKNTALHSKLKETVVTQVQTIVDEALQFTARDRVNTVTTLLGPDPGVSQTGGLEGGDGSLSMEGLSLDKGEGGMGGGGDEPGSNEDVLQVEFNPEKAWSSSYTNRKMNASFSMYKQPMA
jgi:hypothetical protein